LSAGITAGGVEYGRSHLLLIVLVHAAWLIGMWAMAYDRPVEPAFFALVVIPANWEILGFGDARTSLDYSDHCRSR